MDGSKVPCVCLTAHGVVDDYLVWTLETRRCRQATEPVEHLVVTEQWCGEPDRVEIAVQETSDQRASPSKTDPEPDDHPASIRSCRFLVVTTPAASRWRGCGATPAW